MKTLIVCLFLLLSESSVFADINAKKIKGDLSTDFTDAALWKNAEADQDVTLMGQPMVVPKPKKTETPLLHVTAIHDGKWIAFRIRWKDTEPSEGGKLATFSDAVALEFPVKNNEAPPPVTMGMKDDPVHLLHWRYQYQLDAENGKKTVDDIYKNKTTDMYPLEFKDKGHSKEATKEQREAFVGGTAAGNPQSFAKPAVDEIFAEGFGSSAVSEIHMAKGKGLWKDGEWTVYIARPLMYEAGSKLPVGKKSNIGFAVWQGGSKEVGALKSVTMMWTPLLISEKEL
ncbi:MAG: ethylbenzene dehydrogenase-related protein [Pseudobdellovibrionaceae bacterium]